MSLSESKLVRNQDLRRLLDNFLSLSILKVFNLALPFVTLPYLIRVLGFEKYGVIVIALALMQYFQSITEYGFNLSATRDVARHRHSKKQLSYIYSKVVSAKVFLLAIGSLILTPIIYFVPQFKSDDFIFYLIIPILIGHGLFPEWFFRGMERMRYITFMDLSVKLIFTGGVFLFISEPDDYWVYLVLQGAGYMCVAFLSIFMIHSKFNVRYSIVKIKQLRSTLTKGYPLFLNQFLPNLYNNTTGFVIGVVLGSYSAGVFGAVRQVASLLGVFNNVVTMVFFPYLNRNKSQFKAYARWYLLVFGGIVLIVASLHEMVFRVFGIEGAEASYVFYALALGSYSIAMYSVFSTNYLLMNNQDKSVMRITVIASLIGLFLSFPLIKCFGILGGAANILLCQMIMGFGSYLNYKMFVKRCY